MGTILTGYGDPAYDHEGYAAQVLDDGSITGTSSPTTRPRMIGALVAACDCGWAGTTRYPTTPGRWDEHAEQLALHEWETSHAVPVLDQARRGRAVRLARLLAGLAELDLAADLPLRRRRELLDRTLSSLTEASELARELAEEAAAAERQAES